jgi:FAD synthase
MDKNDIALFKEAKCLNTSDGIQKEIITEIIDSIYKKYNQKVNDVVQILGFTFSREEFEKTFRVKAEDLKKVFDPVNIEVTEIEQINIENQKKFDIDDILDKISATGITSLTIEERLFLDNYSNEKGN